MRRLYYLKIWQLFGLLLLLTIVFLSLTPTINKTHVWPWHWLNIIFEYPQIDKVFHFISYTILAMWFSGMCKKSKIPHIFILLFLTGISIEFIQYYVPGRSTEPTDILFNTIGNISGITIVFVIIPNFLTKLDHKIYSAVG